MIAQHERVQERKNGQIKAQDLQRSYLGAPVTAGAPKHILPKHKWMRGAGVWPAHHSEIKDQVQQHKQTCLGCTQLQVLLQDGFSKGRGKPRPFPLPILHLPDFVAALAALKDALKAAATFIKPSSSIIRLFCSILARRSCSYGVISAHMQNKSKQKP